MPLTPVGLAGILVPALIASGQTGIAVPQFSLGIATGASLFLQQSVVTSVDTGTLGTGVTAIPMLVPQPLLLSSILSGFASTAMTGVMAPALALGLATGLATGFLQGLVTMTHPSVGVGAGVAKLIGVGSVPSMIAGFSAAGMIGPGPIKMATAIGIGLSIAFVAWTMPVPILGSPSIAPSSGVGLGKIV